MRRILRIWPLYYLVLMLTFFVLPWLMGDVGSASYVEFLRRHLAAFLLFLGNWSMGLLGPVPYDAVSILWSVCVEEQFYLLCPLLLVIVPDRFRMSVVGLGMLGSIAGRYALARSGANPVLFQYATVTQFDTLLSGVFLALWVFREPPGALASRLTGIVQGPLLILFLVLLCQPNLAHGSLGHRTWDFVALWACGAGLVWVLIARDGWLRAALSYSRVVWLGKVSYGLYMYHEIALWLVRWWFNSMRWFPNKEILQSIAGLAMTIGLAAASYYGFERPFLRLKRYWTRVPSRPV